MLTERQSYFLSNVLVHNKVLCTNLNRPIGVSKDPICKNSLELAKNGKITNNHEGTLPNFFHKGYSFFEAYSYHSKQAITGKALSFIKNEIIGLIGDGAGPELAKTLPLQLHATCMCGRIPFVPEYLNRLNRVIVIEDVSKNQKIPTGP